jgi:transcriptional regulator GlxA family with amidase domain
MTYNIAFVLFPDFEELDYAGPCEVFGMTAKWIEKDWRVYTVGETPVVQGALGTKVQVDYTFDNAPKANLTRHGERRADRLHQARRRGGRVGDVRVHGSVLAAQGRLSRRPARHNIFRLEG